MFFFSCFFFVFPFVFVYVFFLLVTWSKFVLIFPIYIARFQFQNCKMFSFWRVHPLRHPLCRNGCTALCSFGVIGVVKCLVDDLWNSLQLYVIFLFLFLYINSRIFYPSQWRMKIKLITKFWGKLLTNKRKWTHLLEFIYTLMPYDSLKIMYIAILCSEMNEPEFYEFIILFKYLILRSF